MYLTGKIILVIIDFEEDIVFFESVLQKDNYFLHFLSSDESWSFLNDVTPNLILLDVNVAKEKELINRLKTSYITKDIPILYINHIPDSTHVVQVMQNGCADFLTKPLNPTELLIRIRNQLNLNLVQKKLEYTNMALGESVARRTAELEEANRRLLVSEERWQFALEGSGDGVWDWNLETNEVFFPNVGKKCSAIMKTINGKHMRNGLSIFTLMM